MINALRSVTWLGMLTLICAAPSAWSAATVAGKVEVLKGKATALGVDGVERKLQRGGPVMSGDQITTQKRAALSMEFKDGTRFALGADSSMSLDEFVYGKSAEEDKFSAKVLKGAFRFITGLVAKEKPDSMNVQLGLTATIGIRGTNVAGELIGEAATVILLEPEEKGQKTAIEVFNDHGTVTIDEPGFGTEVPDAKSPPSPARRMRQQTIENVIRSMSSVTRALTRPRISVP